MRLSEYIELYSTRLRTTAEKTKAKNLLGTPESKNGLLSVYGDVELGEELGEAIKIVVKSCTTDKDGAISFFKRFVSYLESKEKRRIEVAFPPIQVANSFERLMFIAKYLQDPKHSVVELEDILWVSSRTISEDLKKLKGENLEEGIQILGRRFAIPEMSIRRSRCQMESTMHPFFLTENLSQVYTLLKSLQEMHHNPIYAEKAKSIMLDVWNQLSQYGKERILLVAETKFVEDYTWLYKLDREVQAFSKNQCFFLERYQHSNEGIDLLFYAQKCNEKLCLEYSKSEDMNGEKVIYEACSIVKWVDENNEFDIECNGEIVTLNVAHITRCALNMIDLLLN